LVRLVSSFEGPKKPNKLNEPNKPYKPVVHV
jgi:hypothetical protein